MDAGSMRDFLVPMGYTGRYGHDGFPDPGELTRFFREMRGKSQEWLASKLECSRAMVTRMENEGLGMDNIYTRREVAKYLSITPALLGLVSKEDLNTKVLYDTAILRTALKLHREVYFSSGVLGGVPEVDAMIRSVATISEELNHKNREVLEILCHYYQLGIDVAREEQDYKAITAYGTQAVAIASKLENLVLTVSTLLRLSEGLYEAGDFVQANQYIDMGLAEIKPKSATVFDKKPKIPSHITGMFYLATGRNYSALEKPEASKYLKAATTIARRKTQEEDIGFMRLTIGHAHMKTVYAFIDQKNYEEALETLELAEQETAPNLMRRKCIIQVLQARVYLKQEEYDGAVQMATSALDIASLIGSFPSMSQIAAIYKELSTKWKGSDEVIELGDALTKAIGTRRLLPLDIDGFPQYYTDLQKR
jgi:tetratricopeptide (TPR) repeat protein/transcriptional regulator with XRE-family HTH domain